MRLIRPCSITACLRMHRMRRGTGACSNISTPRRCCNWDYAWAKAPALRSHCRCCVRRWRSSMKWRALNRPVCPTRRCDFDMNRPSQELRYFFTALGYFTRVPVPRWVSFEAHYLNAAARYFPLIGALVGGVGAVVYLAALQVFPAGVAVLLSMAASLLVTGTFHEDGLADCVDAFGGTYTREDVLRIMHDSRIGAFGAIALVIALALKWQTLAALPPWRAASLMIAAHAASRTCAISYLATLDYVRAEGKAKPVAQRLSGPALLCAAMSGLPWLLW